LRSISRVMEEIADPEHKHNAARVKEALATYRKAEDLINIGAYSAGSNPKIDAAIHLIDPINHFLRQGIAEGTTLQASVDSLRSMMG